MVRGCDFLQDTNQVLVHAGVKKCVILGNLITGTRRIKDDSGKCEIGYNSAA